jgi:hypothetical protein
MEKLRSSVGIDAPTCLFTKKGNMDIQHALTFLFFFSLLHLKEEEMSQASVFAMVWYAQLGLGQVIV